MKVDLTCGHCGCAFKRERKEYNRLVSNGVSVFFCSRVCNGASRRTGQLHKCKSCGKEVVRTPGKLEKNTFCSHSCAASHSNKNKKHGTRRSKMEVFVAGKLEEDFADLEVKYNEISWAGCELDIYIPSLKLAVEINGIFHYKPIFGTDKFNRIVENDRKKAEACCKAGIALHVIDITANNIFSTQAGESYYKQIHQLVRQAMDKQVQ